MRTICLNLLAAVLATGAPGPSTIDWRILAGTVVDAQTGAAISGAPVVVSWYVKTELSRKDPPQKTTRTYHSGPEGRFEVRVPPGGSASLVEGSIWGDDFSGGGEEFEGVYQSFGRTVTSWRKVDARTYRMDGITVRLGRTSVTRIYSGEVVDRVSGKPLAGIEVSSACRKDYDTEECADERPVVTDAEGRFVLKAGRANYLDRIDGYALHMDFLDMVDSAGRSIRCVREPQGLGRIEETQWRKVGDGVFRMDGIKARITAMPRITGIVVDAQQRPVRGMSIYAQATGVIKGEPRLGDLTSAEDETGAEGRFSMILSPGEYQLRVSTCQQYNAQGCAGPMASIYYPAGTTDPEVAGRIRLHAGAHETIRVQLRHIATYAVKGTVRFPAADKDLEAEVSLSYPAGVAWTDMAMMQSETRAENGMFRLPHVAPGKYRLKISCFRWVSHPDGSRQGVDHHTMVQNIEVTDHDLEVADLIVRPPLRVRARMRFEDGGPAIGERAYLILQGPAGSELSANIAFGRDGTFDFHELMRGDYVMRLETGNRNNYYCKRFLLNSREQSTTNLDLTSHEGTVELEFILRKAQPRLSGTLIDAAQGAPISAEVRCKITVESADPPGEMSWPVVFKANSGRFHSNAKETGSLPLLRGSYDVTCQPDGADASIAGHRNRLRVPEDYSRNVQWIAGPGE